MDMNNERELRAWCLEMGLRHCSRGIDDALEIATKFRGFVVGKKEIEVSIKDGEAIQKITVPTDSTGTKINLEVIRQ